MNKSKLKISKDEFIEKLKKYLDENFQYDLKEKTIQDGKNWSCLVIINGNSTFVYNIWNKADGLSVTTQGQNQNLADEILEIVTSSVDIVESQQQTFNGITVDVYTKVKTYFNDSDNYNVTENSPSSIQKNLTISNTSNSQKVTFEYYPTTFKANLKGHSTKLWDDVFFELNSHLNLDAKEIVNSYITSLNDLQNISINYDEGIIDEYIKQLLGDEAYFNTNVISEVEKKWLKTSAFLVFTEIRLPEYYASVAPAIKIIEGILNRICIEYDLPQYANFDYFEPNLQNTAWNLREEYKSKFDNNKVIIQIVNDLYNFIRNNRHKLFHNDGISPEQITEKSKAIAIFQQIITLLKQVHENNII